LPERRKKLKPDLSTYRLIAFPANFSIAVPAGFSQTDYFNLHVTYCETPMSAGAA
jgi:hypothetical protein